MKYFMLIILGIASILSAEPPEERISAAVLQLQANGIEEFEARTLTEKLRGELIKTNLFEVIVVDNEQIDTLMKDMGFEATKCTENSCLTEIGKAISVERVIAGSVGKVGNTMLITLRMIDAKSGKIVRQIDEQFVGQRDILLNYGITRVVKKLLADPKKEEVNNSNFGFFGIMNIAKFQTEGVQLYDSTSFAAAAEENVVWFGFGLTININVTDYLDLLPEVIYLGRGGEANCSINDPLAEFNDMNYETNLSSIAIPFLIKLKLPYFKVKPYVLAGPEFDLILSPTRMKQASLMGLGIPGTDTTYNVRPRFKETNLGLNFGGGIDFEGKKLIPYIEARYFMGFSNLVRYPVGNQLIKNRDLQIQMGMKFK